MTLEEKNCYSRLVSIYIERGPDFIFQIRHTLHINNLTYFLTNRQESEVACLVDQLLSEFNGEILKQQMANLIKTCDLKETPYAITRYGTYLVIG